MTLISKDKAINAIIRGEARYSGITCDHEYSDRGCWIITNLKKHRVDHVAIQPDDSINLIVNAIHNNDF